VYSSPKRFYSHLDAVSKKSILPNSRLEFRPNNISRPSMIIIIIIIIIIIVMVVVVMVDEIKIS
jgi:hypothetical protein